MAGLGFYKYIIRVARRYGYYNFLIATIFFLQFYKKLYKKALEYF